MGIYFRPTPPHSGLTGLQGGDGVVGEFYHLTQDQYDYVSGLYSGVTSISATTIYSGSTDIGTIFGPSTFVQSGINITTGGTASRPIINVIGSPVFTAVTASSVSGTSISATTLFSGSTNLGALFGPSTFVAPGVNAYTGGTATRPIVGVIGSPVFTAVTASSVSGTSISATTLFSGSTSLQSIFDGKQTRTDLLPNHDGRALDGHAFPIYQETDGHEKVTGSQLLRYVDTNFGLLDFSEDDKLRLRTTEELTDDRYLTLLVGDADRVLNITGDGSIEGANTGDLFVQPGTNIATGGTAYRPIVSVIGSPVFTAITASSISGSSISATTIFSGNTNIGSLFGPSTFVAPGVNAYTGGTSSRPIVGVVGSPVFTGVTASSVSGTSVSATTFFSGSSDLSGLFGPSTFVAPGVNSYTGGTVSRPIVGVIGSPVFTAVTASSVSGTSISATTIFSGNSDLNSLFGPSTFVAPGVNAYTGGTASRPIVGVIGSPVFTAVTASSVSGTSVSATTIFSGSTNIGSLFGPSTFVAPGVNAYTGGTASRPIVGVIGSPVFTAVTASSVSGTSISATTIFSGSSDLSGLFGPSTFVAPGVNAYTGGTATRPIVGVVGSPVFTAVTASSVSGTSVSATTIFSGSSDLSGLFGPSTFVAPGVNAYTGGTASRPIVGVIGSPVFTGVTASFVSGTSISATTIFSGSSDLSGLFGPSTFVAPGVNAYTGGTASRPIVGVIGSPVFTAVTASSVSGTSVSATTFFSGSTDLSALLGQGNGSPTYVKPGVNITTGGTPSAPVINVVGSPVFTAVTASSVSGTSISATTFFSGSSDLSGLFGSSTFVAPGVNAYTGGTASRPIVGVVGSPVFTAVTASSVSGTSVSATTFFSGSSDLSGLFGPSTFVAPGVNAYTGGTPSRPIVGVIGSPVFTAVTASSVSGTSVSATTLFSGSTNIGSLFGPSTFVAPGVNAYTGGTATRPIVGVIGSPVFTAVTASSVSGTSISGASFYSGSTSFNDILSSLSIDPSRTYKSNLRQASHGLSIGSLVYIRTNGEYTVANSNSLEESKVVGMVTDVIDADSFELTTEGYCDLSLLTTILPALAQGVTYYLTKTPGVLNPSPPTNGGLIKPVFVGIDTSVFYLWNGTAEMSSTGFEISTGNTSSIRTLLGLATNSDVTFNSLSATSSVIAASISATTFFSGSANLGTLFGPSTFVAPGVNAYTGGTPSRPIIGVIGSPVFTAVTASSVSGTSVSATTLYSGATDLSYLLGGNTTQLNNGGISFSMDGGASVISTGQKGYLIAPYSGTINSWTIIAHETGDIVIDVWKAPYASFPPTVADTIAGSEKPTLSSSNKNQDNNLTTWTTSFNSGDIFTINVDSVATVKKVTLILNVTKLS